MIFFSLSLEMLQYSLQKAKKINKSLISIASCDRTSSMAQIFTRIFIVELFYYYYFTSYNIYS